MSIDNAENKAPAETAAAPAAAEAPKKPKRKTYYISRLGLFNPGEKGDQPATLTWAVMDGNPRLLVRTGEKPTEENGYGKITAAMDAGMAGVVLELISMALTAEPGWKKKIPNRSTYVDNRRFDTPQHVNDTAVGKDQEGRIWISVIQEGRPQLRFYMMPSSWHSLVNADGSVPPADELSAIFARGYLRIAPELIAAVCAQAAKDSQDEAAAFSESGGGGKPPYQGGGYQRQGGGGGGYQRNGQGGGGGGYNRQGGQGGGGYQRNNGGGGGGYQRNGGGNGGGGGYQRNNNYQNGGGNNGGGYQQRQQQQQQQKAVDSLSDDDIAF